MKRAFLFACLFAGCLTSVLAPGSAVAASRTTTVRCQGSQHACSAVVGLAGGASNKLVRIELPGTTWRAPRVGVTPKSSRGAYSITGARFASGGSEYRFTLNAARGNPRGSRLTFIFHGL
jgi:hypothetical protein